MGNVRALVGDTKLVDPAGAGTYKPDLLAYYNYYPFGMLQPNRNGPGTPSLAGGYRYGFNGKEKDNNGELGLTSYDYGFRIYNPGIGKFLSVDPLIHGFSYLTPYQFAENCPIYAIDIDGLEACGNPIAHSRGLTGHNCQQSLHNDVTLKHAAEEIGGLGMAYGGVFLAPAAIPYISRLGLQFLGFLSTTPATAVTATHTAAIGKWLSNPENQKSFAEGGAMVAGIMDPNPANQYSAGYSDEFGRFLGLLIRKSGQNTLNYFVRGPKIEETWTGEIELVNNTLHLDFKVPDNLKKGGIAAQMFQDGLNYFGKKVEKVKGFWLGGDNLTGFLDALKAHKSEQEAIFSTSTGRLAKNAGFTEAKIVEKIELDNSTGYSIEFSKPKK
ncbi:MAG: hypothetical protein EOO60_01840 [Hymenobacter sp.]|nr:MAG: hypothetical protein EOO60_01840 [Hymenobacter sp.]